MSVTSKTTGRITFGRSRPLASLGRHSLTISKTRRTYLALLARAAPISAPAGDDSEGNDISSRQVAESSADEEQPICLSADASLQQPQQQQFSNAAGRIRPIEGSKDGNVGPLQLPGVANSAQGKAAEGWSGESLEARLVLKQHLRCRLFDSLCWPQLYHDLIDALLLYSGIYQGLEVQRNFQRWP